MITSRRSFLRSLGAGTAAGIAVHWPLSGISRAATFEPSRPRQDDGLIRLHSNENAYGPSAKVAEAIKASIGSANRYSRMQYDWLVEKIAGVNKVKPEQVLLGCGPTEILRVAAFVFLGRGSDSSISFPVGSFSTSRLKSSFGGHELCATRLHNRSADRLGVPVSLAPAPLVHPTSFRSFLAWGGRCSWMDIR